MGVRIYFLPKRHHYSINGTGCSLLKNSWLSEIGRIRKFVLECQTKLRCLKQIEQYFRSQVFQLYSTKTGVVQQCSKSNRQFLLNENENVYHNLIRVNVNIQTFLTKLQNTSHCRLNKETQRQKTTQECAE